MEEQDKAQGGPPESVPFIPFDSIKFGERLGVGAQGSVNRGWIYCDTPEQKEVAIKSMWNQSAGQNLPSDSELRRMSLAGFFKRLEREQESLQTFTIHPHPHVVRLLGFSIVNNPDDPSKDGIFFILEYFPKGDLFKNLNKFTMNPKMKVRVLKQLADAVSCVHSLNLIHRDIKSPNILFDAHWSVKLCDFGLCRKLPPGDVKMTVATGSQLWAAPEVLSLGDYNQSADVFSIGVVMWEVLTSKPPPSRNPVSAFNFRLKEEFKPSDPIELELWALMLRCLSFEKEDRPTAKEVLEELKAMYSKISGGAKIERDKVKSKKYKEEKRKREGRATIQNRMSTPGKGGLFGQSSSPKTSSKKQIHSNEGN